MTQKEIKLLIKDLCARLPYGVKVEYKNEKFEIQHVSPMFYEVKLDNYETWTVGVENVKPYLFPLSSMTEEQKKEWLYTLSSDYNITYDTIDWLNKNHFDYQDLIEKGLAIDCTNLNIY